MTVEISTKQFYIELFRKNKFNCFPIPIYPDDTPNQQKKAADGRYGKEGSTKKDQIITKEENYAILPTKEGKNCIIDLDDKEKYRPFAENMIKEGYMVIITPNGWHIPVINLGNYATKIELFDLSIKNTKIIEIQGWLHYVIGVGSVIVDKKTKEVLEYKNIGSDKIWDAKGISYDDFVDAICKNCKVELPKLTNTGSYKYLREQFKKDKTPTKEQSNNFYHEAAKQCLYDELTRDEAIEKIRENYDEWKLSKFYSGRSWSNVEYKVNEVYDNPDKFKEGSGRPKGSGSEIDRTGIATELINNREFYSNKITHEVFENKDGFLELINHTLKTELVNNNGQIEKSDYDSILFKMESLAPDMPQTNKDLIVFPNGKFDITKHRLVESDDIADMGFRNYRYLKPTKENEPTEFLKFFKDYPVHEHPRLKMGLRSIFSGHLDSRITTILGKSRVGKTTMISIVCKIIEAYSMSVELDTFLKDRATQAKIKDKRVVVFQDLSDRWEDLAKLKPLTGESSLMIRGFQKDAKQNPNKVKFFITGNMIPSIKKNQKDSMYSARLSLVQNTRKKPYKEDSRFEDKIIELEGEKILSWIINLPDSECKYEDSETVRMEWEKAANPEIEWLKRKYEPSVNFEDKKTVISIIEKFVKDGHEDRDPEQFTESLKTLGYVIHYGVIKNIVDRIIPKMKEIDDKE